MNINVKKLYPHARLPQQAHPSDAGWDLTAHALLSAEGNRVVYGTGLALEIPEGYVGLVYPRSSIRKMNLVMANSVGVIDAGYRGEVQVTFYRLEGSTLYLPDERIAQLIIQPLVGVSFTPVYELSDSVRGQGGHGSSGR